LFLVLLLANILFFAWVRWIAPPPSLDGQPTPSSQRPQAIRLLRESPLADQPAALRPEPGVSAAPGDSATCVSGGPYLDRTAAEQAAARLANIGFTSKLRQGRETVQVGQWVRVENLATPEDAQNALTALRAAGIADAYLLTSEPPGNVVSLGVFGEPARTAQVVKLARRAGFSPTITERARTEDVYWLDVDRAENAGLPPVEVFRGPTEQVPRVDLRACPPSDSVTGAATTP
jgi:hypothetical protein